MKSRDFKTLINYAPPTTTATANDVRKRTTFQPYESFRMKVTWMKLNSEKNEIKNEFKRNHLNFIGFLSTLWLRFVEWRFITIFCCFFCFLYRFSCSTHFWLCVWVVANGEDLEIDFELLLCVFCELNLNWIAYRVHWVKSVDKCCCSACFCCCRFCYHCCCCL